MHAVKPSCRVFVFEFVFKMVSRNKNVHLLDAHVYVSLLRSNIRVSLIRVFHHEQLVLVDL